MEQKLVLSEIQIDKNERKSCRVYGTGQIGKMLVKVLRLLNQSVEGYLITDRFKREEEVDGDKVVGFYEYLNNSDSQKEDAYIFVTVQKGGESVMSDMQGKTANKFFWINSQNDIRKIYEFFYKQYFDDRKIEIDNKMLCLGEAAFQNPFVMDTAYALSFWSECGDLLLPPVFDDLSCIQEGPYEMEDFRVSDGDVVFDCGSNIGLFSNVVAEKAKKVYAFEPAPTNQSKILELSQRYTNIELCQYALGNEKGEVAFSNDDDANYANHILSKDEICENGKSIVVPMTTIDDFIEEHQIDKVDFIKADIEGAEREMLKGARKCLQKYAPKLAICEYHLPDDPEVLENIIKEANPNYVVVHKYMKLYAYVP